MTIDSLTAFTRSLDTAATVIGAVTPADMGRPTPCDEFDVRHLLGHVVGALRRVQVVGEGGDPESVVFSPDGTSDGEWLLVWQEASAKTLAVWQDPALLDQLHVLPFAELTGHHLLGTYASEMTVHTWDLATAIGQTPVWDDGVVEISLASVKPLLPPTRPPVVPFADAVGVPEGAPLIDQLVAWSGRKPV